MSRGITRQFHKTVIYGPGGIGKTELCCLLQQLGIRPLVYDVEGSSEGFDVDRIEHKLLTTWDDLRESLQDESLWQPFDAIVVDSLTKAEELATAWTIANVPHEKNGQQIKVKSIEGYGFGKGYTHVYETFLQLLGDLDSIHRRGKHIVCVAHECVTEAPNPAGEDWKRYEPRLQSPSSGKASVRHRVKEWCDHLVYIGYDVFVSEDGKAEGSGTRTIYPVEMPTHWAKSRSLSDPIPYERGSARFWQQLLGRTEQ